MGRGNCKKGMSLGKGAVGAVVNTSKGQSREETGTTTLHWVDWGNRHKTTGGKKRTKYAHTYIRTYV